MRDSLTTLEDPYGRTVMKLCISVTHHSNLTRPCIMEAAPPRNLKPEDILTFDEIAAVVHIAAELGIRKVKLAGGEPLLRASLENLIEKLSSVASAPEISMTTNGTLLAPKAKILCAHHLKRVTIGLDTLDEDRFRNITSGGRLRDALAGLDAAVANFANVKVNVVALRGVNDDEWRKFVQLARDRDIEVRFIECIPVTGHLEDWKRYFVPIAEVKRVLEVPEPREEGPSRGIAEVYPLPDGKGKIGFIAPVTNPFCTECDRLTLTSWGSLIPCLIEGSELDIRRFLRPRSNETHLRRAFKEAVETKPLRHKLYRYLRPNEADE